MNIKEALPQGFLDTVKEGGMVVNWAPQDKVLRHEIQCSRVSPIIAIPIHLDHPMHARILVELGTVVEIERNIEQVIRNVVLEKIGKDLSNNVRKLGKTTPGLLTLDGYPSPRIDRQNTLGSILGKTTPGLLTLNGYPSSRIARQNHTGAIDSQCVQKKIETIEQFFIRGYFNSKNSSKSTQQGEIQSSDSHGIIYVELACMILIKREMLQKLDFSRKYPMNMVERQVHNIASANKLRVRLANGTPPIGCHIS
ncbi:hypothetical protein RND71_021664 [Anisodus tanguticus]|uniref:Uncharacterized protein n=1 Tax=Anisodus tanguticus TaxID=243964 RepID=A0AAE1RWU9_9SOLA|nr:hypothetical protein RND71_021664 [Anisodus tanguticus]